MLNLKTHIKIEKKVVNSANLCGRFDREDLDKIGNFVHECYQRDVQSRIKWTQRTEAAMDLAMQVQKTKSFPWDNCSNICFPLVTIAALQFHSRAYPAIVNGRTVVQCRVIGADPEGIMTKRAAKISTHMSYQLLEQDESWEEEQDRALLNVPIVGTAFKKSYFDPSKGHNVSELVLAKDLVLDYYAKSVEDCAVKTHIIPLYRNQVHEAVMRGTFYDVTEESWYLSPAAVDTTPQQINSANRAGLATPQPSEVTPFTFLEQHCLLDLDDDGYAEPYIVTIEEGSKQVVRICARFERMEDVEFNNAGKIIKINATEYFTKIPFIPSPDGGIMDIGFGVLLGPLNESVNSAINQLFDAGTVSNTAGGFLGRGAKIRGGVYQFQPFGWNRVDATGDDLRKSIFPLPVREPSNVMFSLLSLLIDYTSRISGNTDVMAGENPGQNTPAETSRAMVEQGMKIYSAIYKRVWRSLKQEFKKLYILNSIHLGNNVPIGQGGETISREDYGGGPSGVIPAADPTITSEGARFAQAGLLKAAAQQTPGYNVDEVERVYLRALGIDQIDTLFPGGAQPPPDVKIQIQEMKAEEAARTREHQQLMLAMQLQEEMRVNNGKIEKMLAEAFKAQQEGEGVAVQDQLNAFVAATTAMRDQNLETQQNLDRMLKEIHDERKDRRERDLARMAKSSDDKASSSVGKGK